MSHNLMESIGKLKGLMDKIGGIDTLPARLSEEVLKESSLSNEDKQKVRDVVKGLNFETLAKQQPTPEELKNIIKSKI
ncbi:MAG: hypothetical protein COA36_16950 [Desulfotalea sp.]|nr:MAG: hypothetical protein COA36_16950 [Desulfotalea sp.]